MSKDLELVEQITASESVVASAQFANKYINKWLHFHGTKWATKFGTCGDGHGRITHAQIYSNTLRECYNLAASIESHASTAKRAYGKELKARDAVEKAQTAWDKIEAECDLRDALATQEAARLQAESLKYQLEAQFEVVKELEEIVKQRYSSFEESEKDNWLETAKYWIKQNKAGAQKDLTALPLPPMMKAKLGVQHRRPEMTLWLQGMNPEALEHMCKNDPQELIRLIEDQSEKQQAALHANQPAQETPGEQPGA